MAESVDAAVLGAVLAGLGYVGKIAWDKIDSWLERRAARKSNLVELQSLVLATKAAFLAQAKIRDLLCKELVDSDGTLRGVPYDEVLTKAYSRMSDTQKVQHGLIRSYTSKAIYPLNILILDWLARDHFFKGQDTKLGAALRKLNAHLVLWRAKFDVWIPDKPERALVYLGDERSHGVEFPHEIDELILRETGSLKE